MDFLKRLSKNIYVPNSEESYSGIKFRLNYLEDLVDTYATRKKDDILSDGCPWFIPAESTIISVEPKFYGLNCVTVNLLNGITTNFSRAKTRLSSKGRREYLMCIPSNKLLCIVEESLLETYDHLGVFHPEPAGGEDSADDFIVKAAYVPHSKLISTWELLMLYNDKNKVVP